MSLFSAMEHALHANASTAVPAAAVRDRPAFFPPSLDAALHEKALPAMSSFMPILGPCLID